MNTPSFLEKALRGSTAAIFSPVWRWFHTGSSSLVIANEDKVASLEQENAHLRSLVQQELLLLDKLTILQNLDNHQRHREVVINCVEQQLKSIPAQVIYRSPAAWSSSLWINVGEKQNEHLASPVIARNSPVLSNGSIIGVVDYVGKKQSRVRLITDSGLTLSVRVARGSGRDLWLSELAQTLYRQLSLRDEAFESTEQKDRLLEGLYLLIKKLREDNPHLLLAKGELNGSSAPAWRSPGQFLRGVGFNYDFPDEEGPARDLRTGVQEGSLSLAHAIPILKVKDLLVTTGYDGVFPAGLPVAEVTKILPLGEGDYYYELEAAPVAKDLEQLSLVTVLPPLGYDETEQAPVVLGH